MLQFNGLGDEVTPNERRREKLGVTEKIDLFIRDVDGDGDEDDAMIGVDSKDADCDTFDREYLDIFEDTERIGENWL